MSLTLIACLFHFVGMKYQYDKVTYKCEVLAKAKVFVLPSSKWKYFTLSTTTSPTLWSTVSLIPAHCLLTTLTGKYLILHHNTKQYHIIQLKHEKKISYIILRPMIMILNAPLLFKGTTIHFYFVQPKSIDH